ncbi:MAG: hypothetical protein AB7I30_02835 [Isosphaeraceae bacterium]
MAAERVNDLRAFKEFIEEKLLVGRVDVTPEEALSHWEIENQTDEEREETLQAIQEGLEDMRAGRTRDAREVLAELRRKYNLGSS